MGDQHTLFSHSKNVLSINFECNKFL